jgi:1,4-alpha-glucan branching enzyme
MVSQQVWSADYGYPGDEVYREFHKSSERSGFKYWRVTNRNQSLDKKHPYDPDAAQLKVQQHAAHFVSNLENTGRHAVEMGFNYPLIVGCYDTELFGHWWWEGINWLSEVMNCIHNSPELDLVLPSQVEAAAHQAKIFESSWGMGGKHYVWENEETSWMWDIIRKAGVEYQSLKGMEQETLMGQRAMSQALKELMLIQSSDWLFMVSNNLTRDYAMKRFYEHYTKLLRLTHTVRNQQFDDSFKEWLHRIQYEDDFFSCL